MYGKNTYIATPLFWMPMPLAAAEPRMSGARGSLIRHRLRAQQRHKLIGWRLIQLGEDSCEIWCIEMELTSVVQHISGGGRGAVRITVIADSEYD